MSSTFTVNPLKPEQTELMDRVFHVKDAVVEYNPGHYRHAPSHAQIQQQILDMPLRDDDIFLVSYPRTGSTWCQEIIWLLSHNLDYTTAQNTLQPIRSPLLELGTIFGNVEVLPDVLEPLLDSVKFIEHLPSPRCIKSHLPLELLPTQINKIKPKIVYIARNPKDVVVSYYYFCKMSHQIDCSFDEFCEFIMQGLIPPGAVFPHYLQFWQKRQESNVLFLRYEDLKRDLLGSVKKLSKFLEFEYSDEQFVQLCDFVSFSKMRENKSVNLDNESLKTLQWPKDNFIRKGVIGDWKNHMSPEMVKRFNEWIEEGTRGTGLSFE